MNLAMWRSAEPGWAEPAPRRSATWALVLLAHAALFMAWQFGLRSLPVTVLPTALAPAWIWLKPAPLPAPAPAPAERTRTSPAPEAARPARPETAPTRAEPMPRLLPAQPVPEEPAAPDATRPEATGSLRLLDNEATRGALRDLARQPLLSERAAAATGQPLRSGAQRMAEAASAAGKGDCNKGEFAGSGAGLLSLPFLAAAVARGDCAR